MLLKILLDENIDVNFKDELTGFDIYTVKENGWTGIENGKLLELVIRNNYNIFITLDSNLRYQQNLSKINLHIIVIKTKDSRLAHLKLFTAKLKYTLDNLIKEGKYGVTEISI